MFLINMKLMSLLVCRKAFIRRSLAMKQSGNQTILFFLYYTADAHAHTTTHTTPQSYPHEYVFLIHVLRDENQRYIPDLTKVLLKAYLRVRNIRSHQNLNPWWVESCTHGSTTTDR